MLGEVIKVVENRNVTDEHRNEMLLVRLTEDEKNGLRKCSLQSGQSMSGLVRLAIQIICYDEDNFNRLLQNIYLEDISSKQYKPSFEDKKLLLEVRDELTSAHSSLKELCDARSVTNHAPNSWKDCLRDYLIPQIDKTLS